MQVSPTLHSNMSSANSRLYYLDAVRAFALLLGIVLHACLSYMTVDVGWVVQDASKSHIVSVFAFISHSFRMELFFLIAGFFSHMTFHRSGAKSFLLSRTVRIGLPLVVGWLLLRPFIISAWIMGYQNLNGDVSVVVALNSAYREFFDGLPGSFLTETHLWFLYYLLLSTAFVLICRKVLQCSDVMYLKVTSRLDALVSWVSRSRFSLLILCPPVAFCLWFMRDLGMDTPDKSLIPHWPVFAVYGGFFLFGWLLHRQEGLIERFAQLSLGRVVFCVIAMVCAIGFSEHFHNAAKPWLRFGGVLSHAGMMWLLVAICIGFFKVVFDQPNKVVRYVADASYWLYLIHLPIVVWLQVAMLDLPYHWSVKLTVISLLTIGFSIVVYDLIVRSTWMGKILNGRKKERLLFRQVRESILRPSS